MLEHTNRDNPIVALAPGGEVAVIDQFELHPAGDARALGAGSSEIEILLPEREARHAQIHSLRQIDRHPAPADANVENLLPRRQHKLRRDMSKFGLLRAGQCFDAIVPIGAAILLMLGIEHQLIMIPYSLDELVAMGQFLVLNTRRGRPFWRSFFRGDALPGGSKDSHPGFDAPLAAIGGSAARGVTVPWTLAISVLIGAFLMFSRLVLGNVPPLADSDHLVGALVITVSVIAMAEVARPLRFLNVAFGAWLIVAPWLMDGGASTVGNVVGTMLGALLIVLSLPRGRRSDEHYGSWDRFVV